MRLSPGEIRGRFAFAAVMVVVGLTPLILLLAQALRARSPARPGAPSGLAVHPSAMIETTLLLVAGVTLAATTAIEARRRPGP